MILFPAAVAFMLAKPVIKTAESFCPAPYTCPAGKPTIGWGSTRYEDGTPVTLNDLHINIARGDVMLTYGMMRVEKLLRPLLTRQPSAHQYATFIDMGYNIGVGLHDGKKGDIADSDMIRLFNAGDIKGAADEILLWDKAHVHGVLTVLPGLVERRKLDRAMFLTPDK